MELESCDAILDFGCGCGRVARHWVYLDKPEIHGCDPSKEAVEWCQANLPFMTAVISQPEPPAPYPAKGFDLIYTLSVFTHLTVPLQMKWARELHRIAKLGGLLVITTHGDSYRDHMTSKERAGYDRGEIIVRYPRSSGANICGAHHPYDAMKALLEDAGWELQQFTPAGAHGVGRQDLYVALAA